MHVLVINSGSSSIKFSIYDVEAAGPEPRRLLDGEISGIGSAKPKCKLQNERGEDRSPSATNAGTPAEALTSVFGLLTEPEMPGIDAAGYRVVHPGAKLMGHQRITEEVLRDLKEASAFAPLHDPVALDVIREGMRQFPAIPHFACFDTEFHRTMPEEATTYPIPKHFRDGGVRRYGFHGLSCESVVRQLRAGPGVPRRMVIAHLGSGCSVTALVEGRSVDTSMGLTPTGGVVMGTRPGDLDPGLVLYLLRQEDGVGAVEKLLNHDAGMVALSGMANDVQALREAKDNAQATLALKVFTRSVTKAIGGYAWLLGGLDAIVFAGGIGEHDPVTRSEVLSGTRFIDESLNLPKGDGFRAIHASDSKTAVFVMPAQEDLMIALHVARMAK